MVTNQALHSFLLLPEQHLTAVYVLYLRSRDGIWHELGSKGLGKASFHCFVIFIGSVMITTSMVIYFGNFHRHQLMGMQITTKAACPR